MASNVKNIVISTAVAGLLVGCGGGGSSAGAGGAGGLPVKGPFIEGTTVKAVHLNTNGSEIPADTATTTIGSDYKFSFNSSDLTWTGPTKFIIENGQYYNEATGGYSVGTLMAVEEVNSTSSLNININILTDIAAKTILAKMQTTPTANIATYKDEAKTAVVETFNISLPSGSDLEDLDLTSSSGTSEEQAANTQLLKLTTAILSTDDPEKVVDDLVQDLGDGSVDGQALASLEEVQTEVQTVDLAEVASKMETALELEDVPNSDDLLAGTLAIGHGISFTSIEDAALNNTYSSSTTIPSSAIYGTSAALTISNGEYRINGGAWGNTSGTVSNGDTLEVRHTSSTSYSSAVKTEVTIGGTVIDFMSTTEPDPFVPDTTANSFDLGYKKGIAPNTSDVESDAIIVSGVNTDTPISISGGEYAVSTDNGSTWSAWTSSAGNVQNTNQVKVRVDSSTNFSSSTDATLTVGGSSDTFKVFTTVEDKTPDLISFSDQSDVEVSTVIESGIKTLVGFNTSVDVSITNGEYSINGGAYTSAAGTVSVNDTIKVRHTSSSDFGTDTVSKLTIGSSIYDFKSSTKADPTANDDTTPNAIMFSLFDNQDLSTEITSAARTVTGINAETTVSITNGTYSISTDNGFSWSAFTSDAGVINLDNQIRVKQTTSDQYQTKTETVLTVGGVSNKLVSYTKIEDAVADVFTFTSQNDVAQNSSITSNTVTIAGINVSVPVSIDNGTLIIDGTPSGTSGNITNGQTLAISHTSATQGGADTYSKVTVGSSTATFKSTTAYAAPQISGTPSTAVVTGSAYSFTPTIDGGDSITSWALTNNPSWMKINSVTGEVYGTPTATSEQVASNGITITATNPGGSDTIVFNTSVDNFVPVLTPETITQTITKGSSFSYDVTLEDKGGDSKVFTLENAPSFVSIDSTTGTISGTAPDVSASTPFSFTIKVTDGSNATDTVAVTLTVEEFDTVNQVPPQISGTPATSVAQDGSYTFTPTANDANSANLVFSITNKPDWADFDTSTGVLTNKAGRPTNADVGTTSGIVITVTEGTGANESSTSLTAFDIEVTNVNDAPTISGTPDTTVAEDSAYSFTPTAEDIDVGDTLTFSIANKPTWATFDTATGALTGTPTNADVGTTSGIVISVTDGNSPAVSLASFDLEVTNVNDAPTVKTAIADMVALEGTPKTFNILNNFEDIDVGDSLTLDVTFANGDLLPSWISFDPQTGELVVTATNAQVGEHLMKATATDTSNAQVVDEFKITITNVNGAPVTSNMTFAVTNNGSNTLSDNVTATDDDANTTLTYALVDDVSNGTLTLNSDGSFTYSPNANFFGDDTFTFKANDGLVDSNTSTVTIKVNDGTIAVESDVDAAIKKLDSIEPETENIETKLAEAKALLNGNTSGEAQILSLSIELAEILNNSTLEGLLEFEEVGNLVTPTTTNTTLLNRIVRSSVVDMLDMSANLTNSVQSTQLSDTSAAILSDMADKLKSISDEFGTVFSSSSITYKYENEIMDYNDSLALRAGILSVAAQLKHLSSFQWGTDADFATQSEDINNITYEFEKAAIDPAGLLNSGNFFKLNSMASTNLATAKQNLLDAADLLLMLPVGYDNDPTDPTDNGLEQEDKDEVTAVKASLDGTTPYTVEVDGDDEIKAVEIDLSKFYDASNAIDITSFGSSWQNLCNDGEMISVEDAKIHGGLKCKVADGFDASRMPTGYHFEESDQKAQVRPTAANSKVDDVVVSMTTLSNMKLTGQGVIDQLFEENTLEAFGAEWGNEKKDARFLVSGNDVKDKSIFTSNDILMLDAYKTAGNDSRTEAKKSFSTPKSQVKAKIRLRAVDSTSSQSSGPVGRGSMIANLENVNAAGDHIFTKLELRDGKIKYFAAKYDSNWSSSSEVELGSGTIASTTTVFPDGRVEKILATIKTTDDGIKFIAERVNGTTGDSLELFDTKTVTTDSSYDLGIDHVKFRSEVRLNGDDGTLYDQVTTPTKLRVHSFSTSTPAPTATLSVGDVAIVTGKNPWYDIFKVENGKVSIAMYEKDGTPDYELDEKEEIAISLTDGSSNFTITQTGQGATAEIKNTEKVSGYTDLYKSDFIITNTEETTETDTWSWDNHGATDLDELVNVFLNGNTYFQDANTTFMLVAGNDNTAGNVVLATYTGTDNQGNKQFTPSSNVVGTWMKDVSNDRIAVDLSTNYKALNSFSLDNDNKIVHGQIHQVGYSDPDYIYTGADAMKFFEAQTGLNVVAPISGKSVELTLGTEKIYLSFLPTGALLERGYDNGTLDYSCYGQWKQFDTNIFAHTCENNDTEPTNQDSKIAADDETRVEILSASTIKVTAANDAKTASEIIDNIPYTSKDIADIRALGSGGTDSLVVEVGDYKVKAFVDTEITSSHTGASNSIAFKVNGSASQVIEIGSDYSNSAKVMLKIYDKNTGKVLGATEYKDVLTSTDIINFGDLIFN